MGTAGHLTRTILALAGVALGCGDRLAPLLCDGGSCGTQVSWRRTLQGAHNGKADILFVLDDTEAMAPHGSVLVNGFRVMAQQLAVPGGLTSIHAGFIRGGSCDSSTRGSACGVEAGEQFLRSEWCGTVDNFAGSRELTFECLADLGAANCAPSQPLSAALRFLTVPAQPGWEGFLRPDAYLMIVVVTAQDDASDQPPGEIAAAIRALKQDPSQTLAAVIGPGDCSPGPAPGPRLSAFRSEFGANGSYIGLCSGGLAITLERLQRLLTAQIEPYCATNIQDTDPETPGVQADCVVEDLALAPDGSRTSALVPSCDHDAPPCWRLVPSQNCPGYIFDLVRGPDWCVEAGWYDTIECLGCAAPNDPACVPIPP